MLASSGNLYADKKSEFHAGIDAAQRGNLKLAKQLFLTAHKKFPGNNTIKLSLNAVNRGLKHTLNKKAVNYLFKGFYNSLSGQYTSAIDSYSKALEIDPRLALAYKERGDAYMKSISVKNLKMSPKSAMDFLAQRSGRLNRQAIRDFDQAIKLAPSYYEAHMSKGKAYGNLAINTRPNSLAEQMLHKKEKDCYKQAAGIKSKL